MPIYEKQLEELQEAALPLIEFINKYGNPHCYCLVSGTSVEFMEGQCQLIFTKDTNEGGQSE